MFYKIRTAVCEDGERIPLIVDSVSALPLVSPNQYVLRARRASCDVGTMEKDLRNICGSQPLDHCGLSVAFNDSFVDD
jgi:hypothetical protein